MTWLELKEQLRDLGFEEDASMNEYNEIVIHASNRSMHEINNTVMLQLEGYFRGRYIPTVEEPEYQRPVITDITTDTPDDFIIELPLLVQPLIALLAAFYLWLDDDERKAVMYYNRYDSLMNEIILGTRNNMTSRIEGGYRF